MDRMEESITEKSRFQSQMQSQRLALPPEPEVGLSTACVSTKESCVDPSGNDADTSDSEKCLLYVEENPPSLVTLGRLYEGSTTAHIIPLGNDQVKVGVEEVRDADAHIPVPTQEGKHLTHSLLGQHILSSVSQNKELLMIPLYLMTLTIPQLFLKSLQVMWDATMFGVFNDNFPLYIKHEYLSEITYGDQCLNISVIQLHMTETSMRAGNVDVYGFLKPQSIQRSGQSHLNQKNSKRDVYLGAYLNGAH
ncbi:hypothetical protein GmHk_10G028258 [Glycine max]|nr:hypothetical protein GmHk_10G028258 [Glycine max]